MRLVSSLSFRKVIIPWYDTNPVCYMGIGFLLPVFLFSLVGIGVAQDLPSPATFLWVPLLLAALSGVVLIRMIARLIRRRMDRSDH